MNMKTVNKKRDVRTRLITAIVCLTTVYMSIMACYCDVFDSAANVAGNLTTKFVTVAEKIFPLSMVFLIVAILVTHDQRMLQTELKTGLFLCVAYIALRLVASPAFMETFTNLGVDGSTKTLTNEVSAVTAKMSGALSS